jgi:DnaD/phage-associated family protein
MARGRMVNKKISNSKRVNDLPLQAQLLFTWLIPHLDCNGCFWGSAQMIKSLVLPRKNWTKKQIESWLKIMEASKNSEGIPLIYRYKVRNFSDAEQYLFMPGFDSEQIGLRKDKEKPEFPTFDGKMTESIRQKAPLSRTEGEGEGEQEIKVEGSSSSSLSPQKMSGSNAPDIYLRVYKIYEDNIGKITEQAKEAINNAIKEYTDKWVSDAIKEAGMRDQPKWIYVKGILRNWKRDGRDNEVT